MSLVSVFAVSVTTMFEHDFMRHAFIVLTALAPLCGLVGYFLVIRSEVFAGDALSHVGFTGSLAALALGFDQRAGLFALSAVAALAIGAFGRHVRVGDTAIGVFFMWILGVGVFWLSVFTSHSSSANSNAGSNVLFGSVFGISADRAWQTVEICAVLLTAMLVCVRPLLFSSFDALVARSRGVPVRVLNMAFMVIVGITVAEAVQVVGALLLLGLIATPAATAHRLTYKPFYAMLLSAILCVVEVWTGLTIAYLHPSLPPSFVLVTTAAVVYAVVLILTSLRGSGGLSAIVADADQIETMRVQSEA